MRGTPTNSSDRFAAPVRECAPSEASTVRIARLCVDARLTGRFLERSGALLKKWKTIMSKDKVPTEVHHRSSRDGRFVTERFANRHPSTTERERIKYPDK